MDIQISTLGNIEIYIYVTNSDPECYERFHTLLKVEPSCLRNVWDENVKAEKIEYNPSLFSSSKNLKEEIWMQYLVGDNVITLKILQDRMVVIVSFKPYFDLEKILHEFISRALNMTNLIIIGFELDFDYEDVDNVLLTLTSDKANYPFLIKSNSSPFEIKIRDNYQIKVLDVLNEKANFILNYFK